MRSYINYLIDGVCFWVIFVVQSAAVSRHGRYWVIIHVYMAQFIPTIWQRQCWT